VSKIDSKEFWKNIYHNIWNHLSQ